MHRIGFPVAGLLIAFCAAARAGAGDSLRTRLAWQIALDRAGFSPGVIDGRAGPKLERATREYQHAHGLEATGLLDQPTASALAVRPEEAITTCTILPADLAQVGPLPTGWVEKSKLKRLAYPSLRSMLAERFHCSRALLAWLNPGLDTTQLKPGDRINVPAISSVPPVTRASWIDIDLTHKVVRVFGADGNLVGLLCCSVAADESKLPSGRARVAVICENPSYTFDPKKWPEVKGIDRKLLIPAGPRNPVGLCWIGLSLHGYGMHGTPSPELIGKTGSHGCLRLTNWDALRLARMVRIGTPVSFSVH